MKVNRLVKLGSYSRIGDMCGLSGWGKDSFEMGLAGRFVLPIPDMRLLPAGGCADAQLGKRAILLELVLRHPGHAGIVLHPFVPPLGGRWGSLVVSWRT